MSSITGVELGPSSSVLVTVKRRGDRAEVLTFDIVDRSKWPLDAAAQIEALTAVRRTKRFPRRMRLVAWTLPDGTRLADPAAADLRASFAAAGFKLEGLLSPADALTTLAASRPSQGEDAATAWVAVNSHGVAIAVVRRGHLLLSRRFDWSYNPWLTRSRDQLLQKYSLVARLAPEIRQAIAAVRLSEGETTTRVVTCGNLPDLRSLTMPLIEELDLDVETLDSVEGLQGPGNPRVIGLADAAPALRLACAAALSAPPISAALPVGWGRAAAGFAIVALLGWGIARSPLLNGGSAPSSSVRASAVDPARTVATAQSGDTAVHPRPSVPEAAAVPTETPTDMFPAVGTAGSSPRADVSPASGSASALPSAARVQPQAPPPVAQTPTASTTAVRPTHTHDNPTAAARGPRSRPPLRAPLPRVDSILIDQNRRLAILDGVVARAGDRVGPRIVAEIQRDGVVLREPSGTEVRSPLRRSSH